MPEQNEFDTWGHLILAVIFTCGGVAITLIIQWLIEHVGITLH